LGLEEISMKKLAVLFALAATAALAGDWSGYVIDKSCSGKKEMWGNEACAKRCMGRGDKAVFVTEDGKVFNIPAQDKVKDFAGKKVTITGKMDGDSIDVESVKTL
jgi:Protein of unknown function (DUF5818)